jgi:hypothetical protein
MANWSKRRTTKAGNQGQRITRTNNSNGTSTYSSSKRVGNTRTTQSTSSKNGKIKIYTTEHHPVLGTKRTVKTLNPTIKYKKPKKPSKPRKIKNYRSSNYNSGPGLAETWFTIPYSGWITVGVLLLIFGAAWYIWLIFISAFLKFEVDFFK